MTTGIDIIVLIGDVPVRLVADDERRAAAITQAFGGAPRTTCEERAVIRYSAGTHQLPGAAATETYGPVKLWRDGSVLLVWHDPLAALVAADTADVRGPVHPRAFQRLCHHVLPHLLLRHERFVVHSAAVSDGAQAILILGATGEGKSTAALAALSAGREVLGDDLVVLRQGASGVEAAGIPRPLAAPSDVVRSDVGTAIAEDRRARRQLSPDLLAGGWRRAAAVALVEHHEGPGGRLQRLAADLALRALVASFPAAGLPDAIRHFMRVAGTLARQHTWRLGLDPSPERRLTGAAAMLDEMFRHSAAADRA